MEGSKGVNIHGHRLDSASLNTTPKLQTAKGKDRLNP